ncbi:MAG: hypothetical protein ACI959_001381 [Limisphaerales bacterium]|jgi:hypothetical protein
MMDSDRPYLITDLKKYKQPSAMEIALLNRGVRNILLIPVSYENVLIGYMELYSKLPNQINTISLFKLRSIVPIMSTAMRQAKEAINNDIEATIRDKFTAIHPVLEFCTVGWVPFSTSGC